MDDDDDESIVSPLRAGDTIITYKVFSIYLPEYLSLFQKASVELYTQPNIQESTLSFDFVIPS